MKISELKQPYRRMAEYIESINVIIQSRNLIYNRYPFSSVEHHFWFSVDNGNHPEITPKIKTHFPADFDFSGEEQPLQIPNNPIIQNRIYTQLAKEGKFEQLLATCEFSEAVELEVWDNELSIPVRTNVLGKFKSRYVTEGNLCWKYAKVPTLKIDFSQFTTGDVVEVEYYGDEGDENIVGYIYSKYDHSIHISSKMTCYGEEEIILNQNIKAITKIK